MNRLHTIPPTEQVYRSHVPPQYDGFSIEKYFATRFSYQDEEEWSRQILAGKIEVNGKTATLGQQLSASDLTVTQAGLRTEPAVDRTLNMIYQDKMVRAFNKTAPIPVHPCGRYFQNSMTEVLKQVYPGEVPRPIQRLDVTTTGIIVFARTREAAAFLMREFKQNRVEKEYLALVEGIPQSKQFSIDKPIGRLKGSKRFVGKDILHSQSAQTDVEWLASIGERSLLKVTPRSGRTNQIRVHLASIGLPIYNDSVYGQGEKVCNQEFGLHHRRMQFQCFDTKIELTASSPEHFQPFLEKEK
ncbi:MAG: RluA family pseudouridine synthase [Nitrospinaceae bacterium]|nr:RluA family pseudouridine synthase [Nitrospinaceae bacterium]